MKIKSIVTNHITESQWAAFCEIEGGFVPYYSCKIVTDGGNYYGKGETKEAACQDAVENMQATTKNEVAEAISKYNAERGVYFVDL